MSEEPKSRLRSLFAMQGSVAGVSTRILSEVFGAPTSISEVEFSIQNTLVNVRSKDGAFLVREGDEVVAVGRRDEGKLKAIAWWNYATRKGHKPSGWYFGPSLFVAIVAGVALIKTSIAFDFAATRRVLLGEGLLAALATVAALSGYYQRCARRLLDDRIAFTQRQRPKR